MKPSWKIGTLFGVEIRIHATFPLVLLWVATLDFAAGGSWQGIAVGVAFTLAIFGMVVLHELGHALAAKRFGIKTRDITLLPIGGIARLDRAASRPAEELWISLAGPAVNAVIAIILFAIAAAQESGAGHERELMYDSFIARLAWANVALAAFNLLPAFPMDGGRVLRALLALRIDPGRATDIAAAVGKGFAVVLGITGIATNPLLMMIAVFVWFGAEQESGATRLRRALEGVAVRDVMMTEFHVLSPADELKRAVEFVLAGGQQHFPVVADGAVVGMLSWDRLVAGLTSSGDSALVDDAMQRGVRTLHESDLVERVLRREQGERVRALPVMRDGRVVGIFTPENLMESVMLRSAADAGLRGANVRPAELQHHLMKSD